MLRSRSLYARRSFAVVRARRGVRFTRRFIDRANPNSQALRAFSYFPSWRLIALIAGTICHI